MSLETIEAIIKMDKGSFEVSYYASDAKPFSSRLMCRFGRLTYEGLSIEEGLQVLAKRYHNLEVGDC